ncbi:hypothetical protein JZ751_018879 [Albula glossodonta]|uniref:Uncharacterized protein n=1 Tax=Albula glossodonta TaxID=121402 RepID=A0A8T2MSX6_9TELE|nr:hypothetical protein JZ751_018879 [Albula glossodonta]
MDPARQTGVLDWLVQEVLQHTGLYREAGAFLVGVERGLSRQAPPDPRAQTRLKTIQETLTLQGTV